MEDDCIHDWEPSAVFHQPGRTCKKCGYFEEITKVHFRQLFKRSFWSLLKEHDDAVVWGGYMKAKKQRRSI